VSARPLAKARATIALAALGAASALLAAACPNDPKVVTKSAAEHGVALFADPSISGTKYNQMSCETCHDIHAGDSGLVKPGAPLAGALERPTYWGGQVDTLLGSIDACLYYHMLKNDPWLGDEDEAQAIYAYLEEAEAEASDEEKQAVPFTIGAVAVPASGDAKHGKKLYEVSCQLCHGAKSTAEGRTVDVAPVLPDQTLKVHAPPDYTDSDRRLVFVEKTRHGGFLGYGGQMPPFSVEELSDQDLADILQYLGVP
jgi:thiosulfate dehydrogenase